MDGWIKERNAAAELMHKRTIEAVKVLGIAFVSCVILGALIFNPLLLAPLVSTILIKSAEIGLGAGSIAMSLYALTLQEQSNRKYKSVEKMDAMILGGTMILETARA